MERKTETKTKLRTDDDFIPPDGGWGWMIVFAAGFSNLSTLPLLQQFGLLFRDRFAQQSISSSETTTIINMCSAVMSCVGLVNGPLFRTFSYRQVSLAGAIVIFVAILCTIFSYNFATYLITFSILIGVGFGITSSANALALNTYWKKRRRLATAFSWTTTGLGPIIWPQIITYLFVYFGESGTILILAGFSLHAIFCAILLHPVEWHSKEPKKEHDVEKLIQLDIKGEQLTAENQKENGYVRNQLKNLSVFSSQYLYNEDDPENPGFEITDPDIMPMMVRANDGYFSQPRPCKRRISLGDVSNRPLTPPSKIASMINLSENHSRKSSAFCGITCKTDLYNILGTQGQPDRTTNSHKAQPKRKNSITELQIPESDIKASLTLKSTQDLKDQVDTRKAKLIPDTLEQHLPDNKFKNCNKDPVYEEKYNIDNDRVSSTALNKYEYHLKDHHRNQSDWTARQQRKSKGFNYESEVLTQASKKLEQYHKEGEEQKMKLLTNSDLHNNVLPGETIILEKNEENYDEVDKKPTFCQKLAMFFDLDLFKDFTFVNLMLGITLVNFSEVNFSILTPFILGDYGMPKQQVAFFMSLLAGVDICVRFCIPFVASKIGWDNSSFFIFGVICMAIGRIVLAYCQIHDIVILVAVMIGFGKGLRTVFMALVIPTHVPLHKLPGASGIQLLTSGIAFLTLGPVVGYIKDNASTAVTLHCLNIFTWLTALSWGLEKYIRSRYRGIASE